MSESSEKKLLRKMLAKLKEKAVKSQRSYLETLTRTVENLDEFVSIYKETLKTMEESPKGFPKALSGMKSTLDLFDVSLSFTFYKSFIALEDLQLYLSSLEEYSAQLDTTLTEIFDAAKEGMEKLEAKRKEMEKRHPEYVK